MNKLRFCIICLLTLLSNNALAGDTVFSKGPIFSEYGSNTIIENGIVEPKSQRFKVVFDISDRNEDGDVSRNFDTVARFINMHVRAGVPVENIEVAMVIHGKAGFDAMNNQAHQKLFNRINPNDELLNLLLDAGVQVFICGQSSGFLGLEVDDLNPRVKMSLSAMTSNALLQQQGYTLNPF